MSINWQFIESLEGAKITKGYVPTLGRSGVTIASGFDIGQRSERDIKNMGLDNRLTEKLLPYTNMQGNEAVRALAKRPLNITHEEADTIDKGLRQEFVNMISSKWDRDSYTDWNNLENEQQTVIASVTWQYGTPWRRCPKFWGFATRGEWNKVIDELQNFGDAYATRRRKEANYLKNC